MYYEHYDEYIKHSNLDALFNRYWHRFFNLPLDTMPWRLHEALTGIRKVYMQEKWHWVYDFIEFTAKNVPDDMANALCKTANNVLEAHRSAYRFVDRQLVEVTSEEELSSIEEAIGGTSALAGVQAHLKTALGHLADRKKPDYRNSIKESVSAVEALAQVLTGKPKATLGEALKVFEKKAAMHPALKTGLSALYGWTSDAEGIRHAMLDESHLTFNDAKFMLVACTAFVNFLLGKAAEEGIKLNQPKK